MILELKKLLIKQPENIKRILEHFGFYKINISSKEIRFARDENGNSTSLRILLHNNNDILINDFAKARTMDIIYLIMKEKKVAYADVINCIKSIMGIDIYSLSKPTKRAVFGGIYDNYKSKNRSAKIHIYPKTVMNHYIFKPNLRFIKDNISIETQKKFDIGFDVESQRIVIPIYDSYYNLLGVKGRLNQEATNEDLKYVYMMPTQKHLTMYGYCQNYEYLYGEDILIGEAEKFVLQCDTYEYYSSLAIGGNALTEEQCKIIFSLNPKSITLAFDMGLENEVVKRNIELLKQYLIMRDTKIKLWDSKNSRYINQNKKDSITDRGREVFYKILKEEIIDV